jgi:hypothetical protein
MSYLCLVCAPADEGDSEDEAEEEDWEFEEEEESVIDVENKVGEMEEADPDSDGSEDNNVSRIVIIYNNTYNDNIA